MSQSKTVSKTVSHSSSKRRYWIRTDTPKKWWPWGVLPLAGLFALFAFGALVTAPQIQAEVRQQVLQRYDAAGTPIKDVSSDGQGVLVRAGSVDSDSSYLHALARSTDCETWAGKLNCPTSVNIEIPSASTAGAEIEARAHPFEFARKDGALMLYGDVPSIAEQERLLAVADRHFDSIDNQLTITNEVTREDYSHLADQALAAVSRLDGGQATWSGSELSVSGVASDAAVATLKQEFDQISPATLRGAFDVRAAVDATRCNEQFGAVLAGNSVRFRTGSADIDAGNDELLQQLAEIAGACPGTLLVAGHTDSQGDRDMNAALSQARAASVRGALIELGIAADRLSAKGFGESQPIGDNTTAAGRARNRRIEISIGE